jgi:hypothetical protein
MSFFLTQPFTVPTVRMKTGSLLPLLRVPLTYADGTPIDLTDATGVTFTMRERDSLVNLAMAGVAGFYDRPNGGVEYAWAAGDTDTSGCYVAEFRAIWPPNLALVDPGDTFMVVYLTAGLT